MAQAQTTPSVERLGQKLPLVDGIKQLYAQSRIIVPFPLADKILTSSDAGFKAMRERLDTKNNGQVCSGKLFIYVAPDQPFGEEVRVDNLVFKVRTDLQTAVNHVIQVDLFNVGGKPVIEFTPIDGALKPDETVFMIGVKDQSNVTATPNFPRTFGGALLNADGVPQGTAGMTDSNTRWVFRRSANITLASRSEAAGYYGARTILLDVPPSVPQDILVFTSNPS